MFRLYGGKMIRKNDLKKYFSSLWVECYIIELANNISKSDIIEHQNEIVEQIVGQVVERDWIKYLDEDSLILKNKEVKK